jgi:hypothetical protein
LKPEISREIALRLLDSDKTITDLSPIKGEPEKADALAT